MKLSSKIQKVLNFASVQDDGQKRKAGGLPLCMRASLDYRKDFEVKKEIFENKIRDFFQVLFVVDDRQQVVDMWRNLGLVCLQCDYGDF